MLSFLLYIDAQGFIEALAEQSHGKEGLCLVVDTHVGN
jgi:hypothetical protein